MQRVIHGHFLFCLYALPEGEFPYQIDYSPEMRTFVNKRLNSFISLLGCGGDLNTKFGAVTSPMYSIGYNDTYDCQWKITVTAGKRVFLKFTDFSLPHSASCSTTDYVEVN